MSRYTCDDCSSIFYEPNEDNGCPLCNSVNIHKDWSYVEREEALEQILSDLDELNEMAIDLRNKVNARIRDLHAELSFDDLILSCSKMNNLITNRKDRLKNY